MFRWTVIIISTVLLSLVCVGFVRWKYTFPHGYFKASQAILSMVLRNYAEENGGWYPAGEATPEASLSLLYRFEPSILYHLRGKTIPDEVLRSRLENGLLLTPESCGWHYVEGLHINDSYALALAWEKCGLGTFGQRMNDGGRTVIFVGGSFQRIPGNEWDAFLAEQVELRKQLVRPLPDQPLQNP